MLWPKKNMPNRAERSKMTSLRTLFGRDTKSVVQPQVSDKQTKLAIYGRLGGFGQEHD